MTSKNCNTIVSLFLLVTLASGCASAGTKVDPSAAARIQKGITTKEQVVALLGTPMADTLSGDGKEMMYWSYSKAQMKGATFIPIVGLFAGGADVKMSMFQVVLGPDKVVQDYLLSDSSFDSRMGH